LNRRVREEVFFEFFWKMDYGTLRLGLVLVLVCYAATQLATQLQQRRIQVVCSFKVARKRLTESKGTPAMFLEHKIFF